MNRRIEHHRPDRRELTGTHGFGDLCCGPPNARQRGEITYDVADSFDTQSRDQLIPAFFVAAQQYQVIVPRFGEEAGQC